MKKIVVLLSAYNGEKYILDQINSIISQKVNYPLTLIIRDDGSTDSTYDLITKLSTDNKNIKIIPGKNIGAVASFFELINIAFEDAEYYDYFSLADQDDVWDDDKLALAIKSIEDKSTQMDIPLLYCSSSRPVNSDLVPIYKKKRRRKKLTYFNTMIQNSTPGHTYVFNRALAGIVRKPDTTKIYVHDSFIINAAIIHGNVIYDNGAHTSYRQHSSNQLGTSNKGLMLWIKTRIRRINRGDCKKYAAQIQYIYETYYDKLSNDERRETELFLDCRNNIIKRIRYAFKTRFYRQRMLESFLFRVLYVFGGYND